MYKQTNVDAYAIALFELAKEQNIIKNIHDILVVLMQNIKNDDSFITYLTSYESSKEDKYKYLDQIFNEFDFNNLLTNFFKVIVENNSARSIKTIIGAFLKLSNEHLKIRYGKITTAFELSEAKLNEIKTKLEEKYQFNIVLEHEIDPSLIAGFRIKIDSLIIENSFNLTLDKIQNSIMKKEV
ncbi:F0F1 ATP synthase subunit delta [Mycoplasmopsis gallinarum]